VYSYFSSRLHASAFVLGLQTRLDQAAEALAVSRQVLRDFVTHGPIEAELNAAQGNLTGGFALRIDANRKLLTNDGLLLDYLDHWAGRVRRVSMVDIQTAFQRMLQPDRMVTVVGGGGGRQ